MTNFGWNQCTNIFWSFWYQIWISSLFGCHLADLFGQNSQNFWKLLFWQKSTKLQKQWQFLRVHKILEIREFWLIFFSGASQSIFILIICKTNLVWKHLNPSKFYCWTLNLQKCSNGIDGDFSRNELYICKIPLGQVLASDQFVPLTLICSSIFTGLLVDKTYVC